ncbi:adenosine receptor A1-like [Haliotis asinina]|uniref:adenosine receptor A1-like n=1 Tax=Haliotis asinina TaxID=109174 RepID=UPI0035318D79
MHDSLRAVGTWILGGHQRNSDAMETRCPETLHFIITTFIRVHPSIVFFCALLVIVGIPGNGTIFYIYTKKINIPVFSFFTKIQAMLNLVGTSCLLPALVLFKTNIEEAIFCKWFSVGQHVLAINTGMLYVIIAVHRYRRLCSDQPSQINIPVSKKILLGCVIFSLFSVTPHAFLINMHYTALNVTHDLSKCLINIPYSDFTEYAKKHHLSTMYLTWLMLELFVIVGVLTVLYSLIGKHVGYHKRQMSRYFASGQGRTNLSNPMVMFFTMTVIFLLSVAPRIGMAMYTRYSTYSQSVHHVRDVMIMLPFINCVSNPFVYVFTSKVFRMHVVSLFCADGREESTSPPSITVRTQESVL